MLALSLQCHNHIEDFQLCSVCRDIPCCYPPGDSEESLKLLSCSISGWRFDSGSENSHSLQHGNPEPPCEMGMIPTWHFNPLYEAVVRGEGTPWQLNCKGSQLKLKMAATSSSNYTPAQGHSRSMCSRKKRLSTISLFCLVSHFPLLEPKVICPHKTWELVGHQLHDKKEATLALSVCYLLSRMWILDLKCFPWCFDACVSMSMWKCLFGNGKKKKKRNKKQKNVIFWGFGKVMQKLFPDQHQQLGVQDKTSSEEGKPRD